MLGVNCKNRWILVTNVLGKKLKKQLQEDQSQNTNCFMLNPHLKHTRLFISHFQFCDTCCLSSQKNVKTGDFIEKYTLTPQGLTTGILQLLPLTIWRALRPPFMKISSHTTKGSDWLSGHSKLGNVNTIY